MTVRNLTNYNVNGALDEINKAEYGAHYMIIYPDLDTLRDLYSSYVHKQIKECNESVLINPFYETTDSVRQILSHGLDVDEYEKQKALIIIDSEKEYFGHQPDDDMSFKTSLANYAKQIGKNGLSILGDIGAYPHRFKHKDLVDYESSLPTEFEDVPMKGFCLYHQKDFDKFSDEQQKRLIEHHEKAIEIIHV